MSDPDIFLLLVVSGLSMTSSTTTEVAVMNLFDFLVVENYKTCHFVVLSPLSFPCEEGGQVR
jgi:hypothetical protein